MSHTPRPPKLPSSVPPAPAAPPRRAFGAPSAPARPGRAEREPMQDPQGSSPEQEIDVSLVDATVFEPDPEQVEKLKKKSANVQAKTEAKTRQEAIQAVQAMHLLAPAICRAMGRASSEDQQVEDFVEQAARARQAAAGVVDSWSPSPDDRPWVAAAVERVFLEHPTLMSMPLEGLGEVLGALPAQVPPPPTPWLSPPVAAAVALLGALGPVAQAQLEFGLGRKNPQADLRTAARNLAEAAQDAVLELADPTSTQDVRLAIFSAALGEAGKAMAWFWRAHARRLEEHAQARTAAQQETWKRAHPEGEDLEPVFKAFSEHSARLRRLARMARPR